MLDAVFNSAQELTEGYVVWLICTVILCLILLKFGYKNMLEIHNDDTDYSDEFDDDDEGKEKTDVDQMSEEETKEITFEKDVEEKQMSEISAENHPAAEIVNSEPKRGIAVAKQSDKTEIIEELMPQQQKIDKVLTFLAVTFCFFVFSGLVMKIFLYLVGLIFLLFGAALSSIGAIIVAIIFFIFLAFIL